jgi:hypothetical protein
MFDNEDDILLTFWVRNFGIFEFARLNRTRSEAERNNSGRALKQLAIFDAGQIQESLPKLHNVVRKITSSLEHIFEIGSRVIASRE